MSPLLFIFALFWATALPDLYLPNNDTKKKTNANADNKTLIFAEMNELMDGLEPKKKPERRQYFREETPITAPQFFAYGTSQGLWDLRLPSGPWSTLVKGGHINDGYTDFEIYLVRVYHGKEIVPAYVRRDTKDCYGVFDNKELRCTKFIYEFLFNHPQYMWSKTTHGQLANGIVESGIAENYAFVYHCTFLFSGHGYKGELIGSIYPFSNNCSTILGGHKFSSRDYWVLKDARFA